MIKLYLTPSTRAGRVAWLLEELEMEYELEVLPFLRRGGEMYVAVLDIDLGAGEPPSGFCLVPQRGIADLIDRRIRRCL